MGLHWSASTCFGLALLNNNIHIAWLFESKSTHTEQQLEAYSRDWQTPSLTVILTKAVSTMHHIYLCT